MTDRVALVKKRLDMVASNPMDVPGSSAARPLLPAERDVNAAMNGFNAGVVNFLKGEPTQTANNQCAETSACSVS